MSESGRRAVRLAARALQNPAIGIDADLLRPHRCSSSQSEQPSLATSDSGSDVGRLPAQLAQQGERPFGVARERGNDEVARPQGRKGPGEAARVTHIVCRFHVEQNMSDHSLLVLAFGATSMPRKIRTNPRKSASQQRSRLTVNALLEATARILVREGFDKASTNRIAAVAGVSVGYLYQYFPSKEALVAALIDRHNQEVMRVVRGELAEAMDQPMERAVRKLVAVAVQAHRVDPKLHRVLAEQIPRVGKLERVESFNRENYALFTAYLESHRDEIRAVDLGLAAFVCVTSIEALTHSAVVHHRIVSNEAMEALIDETTRLVVGYLTG